MIPPVPVFRRLALLDAIRIAFEKMEPLLDDPALSGVQIRLNLTKAGAVRAVIVEPELRFENQ